MKKYLPFIVLFVGLVSLVGVILIVKSRSSAPETVVQEETTVAEIPDNQKPYASLTPTKDGHWLKLNVEGLDRMVVAKSLDYELLYKVSDGRTQGVPGTVTLKGDKSITRDLLLGSESSGKFRYDVGVDKGTLTLRLRDDKGKLLGKLSTDFTLSNASGVYLVTMDHFGTPVTSQ